MPTPLSAAALVAVQVLARGGSALAVVISLTGCRDGPSATGRAAESPAQAYQRYCAVCHGVDGHAVEGTGSPSLNHPALLAAADDAFLYTNVAEGRPGTTMTTYLDRLGGPLTETEIRGILGHVRGWGAFRPEALRQLPAGDPDTGARLYQERCAECHGREGTSPTAPDLANPTFQATASDAYIVRAITDGRPDAMAGFPELGPQELADLLAAVRALGDGS
jgi:cbb3-type cytochrome c oxidase subunit III